MKLNNIAFLLIVFSGCLANCLKVQSSQPHNSQCFTQGLSFINSTHLFESCGLYNKSFFSVMEYVSQPFAINYEYTSTIPWKRDIFLEGSVLFKNFIYMLTWKQQKVYKLNPSSYEVVKQLAWSPQGWGLTTNQTHMFTSDGSSNIYIVDENFTKLDTRRIVHLSGLSQYNINQLQYANGFIYANVFMTTTILKINIDTGVIVEQYDASNLLNVEQNGADVLNGIAYDKKAGKFLLTGKLWSKIHLVDLEDLTPLSAFSINFFAMAFLIVVLAI